MRTHPPGAASPAAALALLVCAAAAALPLSAAAAPHDQGTTLDGTSLATHTVELGGALDRFGNAMSGALYRGTLTGTTAFASLSGGDLVGATFSGTGTGGAALTFQIVQWQPHVDHLTPGCSAPGDDSEYEVSYRAAGGGGPWTSLCANRWAIPVSGTWNAAGDHFSSAGSGTFTFACVEKGVIAKCFDWCYKPYLTVSGVSLEGRHQSCTRMARADYCGRGLSNTVDNTRIDSADDLSVTTTDCPSGPACTAAGTVVMNFEAAWREGWSGAANRAPQSAVLCLSKKRWQTMPLKGNCADVLPDPRDPNSDGVFCDDLTLADLVRMGAQHVNWSSFIDVGLWSFRRGPDYQTTAAGDSSDAPDAGYVTPGSYEGALYRIDDAPAVLPASAVLLTTWLRGADYFTTTLPPGGGWSRVRDEGWIFPPLAGRPTSTARKLYCYTNGTDHLSTTQPAPPPGYTTCVAPGFFEGWLPR